MQKDYEQELKEIAEELSRIEKNENNTLEWKDYFEAYGIFFKDGDAYGHTLFTRQKCAEYSQKALDLAKKQNAPADFINLLQMTAEAAAGAYKETQNAQKATEQFKESLENTQKLFEMSFEESLKKMDDIIDLF